MTLKTRKTVRHVIMLLACLAVLSESRSASAGLFENYQRLPSADFRLPDLSTGLKGGAMMDNLPDGRRVIMSSRVTGILGGDVAELRVETGVGAGTYKYIGDIPVPVTDPIWYNPGGFLTISQNTSGTVRVAIGNSSSSVGVFDAADLDSAPAAAPATPAALPSLVWHGAGEFTGFFTASASWLNNTTLAVSTGDFSGNSHIDLLNVTGGGTTLILDALGGTGGSAFKDGNLYYGIGFGAGVGQISRFDSGIWPAQFGDGTPLTTLLSAGWLEFDSEGNLFVGGGDTFGVSGQYNYFAIFDGTGLNRPTRTFDPDLGSDFSAYNLMYNQKTGILYVWDNFSNFSGGDNEQVWAYSALVAAVPEPSTLMLGTIALGVTGLVFLRRRRAAASRRPALDSDLA